MLEKFFENISIYTIKFLPIPTKVKISIIQVLYLFLTMFFQLFILFVWASLFGVLFEFVLYLICYMLFRQIGKPYHFDDLDTCTFWSLLGLSLIPLTFMYFDSLWFIIYMAIITAWAMTEH